MSTRPLPRALSIELRLQSPGLDVQAQFRVLPGRVCALVGRSGSGKSALLQAAAGLIPSKGGRVALGNEALYDSAARIDKPPHERRLTWIDGNGHLFPHLRVRANLQYGTVGLLAKRPGPTFERIVNWLDLAAVLEHRPEQLTATQRWRVSLGRALLSAPHALFLDDPLSQLPEAEREAQLELLADATTRFGLPIVLVSPRMNEVIRLADEIVILHEGRMASAGPAMQILSDVSLATFLEGAHAGSVLEGEVKRHDIEWLLSEVDVGGQRVTVPAMLHPISAKVRIKVRARDVSLHRHVPSDTSTSNHLRGRITQIMLAGEHGTYGAVGVALDRVHEPGEAPQGSKPTVWAMMTRKAIQQMDWAPGHDCIVGFEAMATTVTAWR